MEKSKKIKTHKKIDGQLLQMNKKFTNLKMKQKDKITGWVYEEYRKYVTEHDSYHTAMWLEYYISLPLSR